MKKEIRHIYLSREERSILLKAVNDLRSRFIAEGLYTDVCNELLVKLASGKFKKMKVVSKESIKGGGLQYA